MRQDKDTSKAPRYEAWDGVEVAIPSANGTAEQVAEQIESNCSAA
jgi:hypothetical protein